MRDPRAHRSTLIGVAPWRGQSIRVHPRERRKRRPRPYYRRPARRTPRGGLPGRQAMQRDWYEWARSGGLLNPPHFWYLLPATKIFQMIAAGCRTLVVNRSGFPSLLRVWGTGAPRDYRAGAGRPTQLLECTALRSTRAPWSRNRWQPTRTTDGPRAPALHRSERGHGTVASL